MFGAMAKSYYAEKMGLRPEDIFVVSVMPCTAKKFEITREGECGAGAGIPDVDVALTTRELGQMIQRAGLLFAELPEEEFDPALGIATGAGHIFGASGGVMEAALRTASELLKMCIRDRDIRGDKFCILLFTHGSKALLKPTESDALQWGPAPAPGRRSAQRRCKQRTPGRW